MQISKEALNNFVETNPELVQRKESKRYPGLFVLKYTRKVFYDNLWEANKLLLECRGLVVNADYEVIVKPFTKVFNYGENGTTIADDALCTVVRKVNGFMACATRNSKYSDELIISTTGSLDSEHVDIAKRHINMGWRADMYEGETYIFEICDKDDPHIVTEAPGAYLIGGNGANFSWDEDQLDFFGDSLDIMRPEVIYGMRFSDVVALSKTVDHEGFMVYSDKQALKIKSPHYLITKFLARMGDEKLKNILLKGDIRQSMRNFDEEYYPLIVYITSIMRMFEFLSEQDRIQVIRDFLSRKE